MFLDSLAVAVAPDLPGDLIDLGIAGGIAAQARRFDRFRPDDRGALANEIRIFASTVGVMKRLSGRTSARYRMPFGSTISPSRTCIRSRTVRASQPS